MSLRDDHLVIHAYRTGGTFLDACREHRGRLRLRPSFFDPKAQHTRDESPFEGIERETPQIPAAWRAHVFKNHEWEGSLEAYGNALRNEVMAYLRRHWRSDLPTLVAHSSGYDSRIISQCLVELREEGFDLGRVHFRCHEPENEMFLRIMDRQGWRPDQFSVWPNQTQDTYDIGRLDDPGTSAWLPLTMQLNFWRDLIPYEEQGEWVACSGIGGGEAFDYPAKGKIPVKPFRFCENEPIDRWCRYFAGFTDWAADWDAAFHHALLPFFGAGYAALVAAYPFRFRRVKQTQHGKVDLVRAAILETFDDDLMDIPYKGHNYRWAVSGERAEEMRAFWGTCLFRSMIPEDHIAGEDVVALALAKPSGYHARLWRFASLYEQLVEEGYA